jgi:hypothetical protein
MNTTETVSRSNSAPSTGATTSKQQIRSYYLREQVNIFRCKDGRPSRGIPQALFVSKVDQEKKTISFAFSVCYSGSAEIKDDKTGKVIRHSVPADAFSRDKARAMALGRLEKKPWVIPLPDKVNGHTINIAIMNAVLDDYSLKEYIASLQAVKGLTNPAGFDDVKAAYELSQYAEKLVSPRLRKLANAWLSRPRAKTPNAGQLVAALQVLKDAKIDISLVEKDVEKVFAGNTFGNN